MIDIDFPIFHVNYDCSMIGLTCLGVMLDNQISDLWISGLLEMPPLRILYKVLTIGARVVLIVKCRDCVYARLELLIRKCHIDSSR